MSEAERPKARGVVIAHGDMARGLVDAVQKISGHEEGVLVPVSNEGRSLERMREEIRAAIGDGPTIVFTDLQAGSCAVTALASAKPESAIVLCGTNLPMLLDFVFHRDLPLDELAARLVEHGRQGIKSLKRRDG